MCITDKGIKELRKAIPKTNDYDNPATDTVKWLVRCSSESLNRFTIRGKTMLSRWRAACAAMVCLSVCLFHRSVQGQEPAEEKAPTLELKLLRVLKFEEEPFSFTFSSDGQRFAASSGNSVSVRDTHTWKEVRKFEEKDSYSQVYLSPDGGTLAVRSNGYRDLKLLDVASGKLLRTLQAYTVSVDYAAFSPDGKMIVTAGRDAADGDGSRLKFWDLETGKEVALTAKWRLGGMTPCALSPRGDMLAVCMEFGAVRLLDGKNGKEIRCLMPVDDPALSNPCGLAFSPDGRFLAVGRKARHNLVTVWDVRSGKPLWQLKWPVVQDPRFPPGKEIIPKPKPADPNHPPGNDYLAFTADGRSLVVACCDGTIRVWELSTGGLRYKMEGGGTRFMTTSRGSLLALVKGTQKTHEISVWDYRTPMTSHRPSTPPAVEKIWTSLDTDDAASAFERMRELVSVPKETVALLDQQLRTLEPVEATVLDGLVHDLDDGDFKVRDRALRRLEELGEIAKPVLTKALVGKPSAEARKRIKELLDALDGLPSGNRLRTDRGLEPLEMIGSPEARGVLKRLAGGVPEALRTRQAKAALERLDAN